MVYAMSSLVPSAPVSITHQAGRPHTDIQKPITSSKALETAGRTPY
jgi:hypothetical protein